MNALQVFRKIKRKIKRKRLMNKIISTPHDNKLIHYIEKCDYSDIETLDFAYYKRKSAVVILKMLDVGGRELFREKNENRDTALMIALWHMRPQKRTDSTEVIMKMIEIGGRQLVLENRCKGYNTLHHACMYRTSTEVIMKLIELGGRQIVMEKNRYACTTLHYACSYGASTEVIMKMIEIGGRQLVMEKRRDLGCTALHHACQQSRVSTEVIMKLIEVGGRQLVMDKNPLLERRTALHFACGSKRSAEVILKLIDVGGRQLLMEKDNNGYTALHHACRSSNLTFITILVIVGGQQYGRTALDYVSSFNNHEDARMVLEELSGTTSNKETKEIVKASVKAMILNQKYSVIHLAAKYGLKWSITKEFIAQNLDEAVNGYDSLTGLRLFMIAAMGNDGSSCDLSSIYGLMRMSPIFS